MPKYKEEQESRYISRTVAILSELPEFCTVFYDKKDAEAMFLVTIGRYKGARLGVRSIERIVSTIRKRQL